ncbi:transposase [Halonotius sp. GCM10025705]|uniref:transposase n=1 Tax=Halonotius sp. GCM10025705 TaxID=3252678 RepID=UPI00360C58C8
MLKAVLLDELTGASDAAVHRTLGSNPETAAAIGFAPDDVPDQSTLSRAFSAMRSSIVRSPICYSSAASFTLRLTPSV